MTNDIGIPVQIHRADHGSEHPYFIMRRKTAQDTTLSFEARGVIAYLLSKPDDWIISETELRKAGDIGRDKMKRILQELIEAAYMTSTIPRIEEGPNKAQFLPKVLALHECPNEPLTEKPSTANPSTANPHLHNTDSTKEDQKTGEPQSDEPISDPDCAISASAESRAVSSEDDPVEDEKPFIKEWKERGYEVGQSAYWWYEDGNKYVAGEIVRFTAKFAIFKSTRIDNGETVEKRIGPGRCSVDGSTEGWHTLDDLDLLERAVAIGSYSMTDEQTISGDRLKNIRGHLKYLRTQFQNGHTIDENELRAAYGWQKAQSISAPKRSDALADMVNGYREAKAPAQQSNTPDPVEEADPTCPKCNGGGRLKLFNSGKLIACPCREKGNNHG